MKKIVMILGVVGIVVGMMVAEAMASQIMGMPLYTDPGAHERIMSSPRPEGFRYGWPSPPSVDLEVEWKVIGPADAHRSIRGIFIDQDGTIRVVDICRKAMRGMRVWLSRNSGRNWKIEKSIRDAWTDRSALLGKEKGKVLFSPSHMTQPDFQEWPIETEELIKTEFRGLYEQRAKMSAAKQIFLAMDPNDEKVMAFAAHSAGPPGPNTRLFVTVDGEERWTEINPPPPEQAPVRDGSYLVGGLAIERREDVLKVFLGARGIGSKMVQVATIDLSELEKVLKK